ncbi:MAG TPA: putative toxin-antitoxin system toxin component, PIN family [Pirellulales bacterium]|jgi:putative PIN family toxin of toxin-antitoxin system|nr:putative toxin-antitoxin system toxin component, PIN family [Pirellulales bacterium]
MRVVLDTNLIVRAAGQTGLGREILMQALSDRHTLVLSHSLFAEIRRVLHHSNLRALHGLDDSEIQRFLDELALGSEHVGVLSYHIGPLVGLDPSDDMVLLTATAGQADVLGTNNKHFYEADVQQFAKNHGLRILRDVELITELRR